MKEKLVKVFEKAFWPFMICIGIVLFSMLIIGLEKMEIKKAGMYCVQMDRKTYWTEQITLNQDGSVSFVDFENKRPYRIYGGTYIIAQPKIK
jgi:hypothetical protein